MYNPANIVKMTFQHKRTSRIPKGELWLGTELFKILNINDDIKGHFEIVRLLGQDIISFPLSNERSMHPILKYRYFNLKEISEASKINEDLFLIVVLDGPFQRISERLGFLKVLSYINRERSKMIREFDKEFSKIDILIERCLEFSINAFVLCDDLAGENNIILNPEVFFEIFSQFYKSIIFKIHQKGAYLLFHSCGKIISLISQLISIGFDGFAAIQDRPNDLVSIKKRFGKSVTLMAGIDSEILDKEGYSLLILREFEERLKQLTTGGGFILCSSTGLYSGDFLRRVKEIYKIVEGFKRNDF